MTYISEFFIPKESPKIVANKIRSETVGDEIPVDIEKICEINGNIIIYRNLPDRTLGLRERNPDNTFSIIIDQKIKNDERRRRYTIAHELGHVLFDTHYFKPYVKASKDENNPNSIYISNKFETEADQFASELLMPEQPFKKDIRKIREINGWHTISDLSKHYNTSLQSTTYRFISFTSEICAFLIFGMSGEFISISYSEEFKGNKFFIPKGNKTPPDSIAFEVSNNKTTNKSGELPVNTWCPSFKNNRQTIFEYSFKALNQIYTLLYVKKLIDQDLFLI